MVRAKRIFCVVAYDIEDNKVRLSVSKVLEKYGVRINYSVFECMFTPVQYQKVKLDLENKLSRQRGTIVFYPICVNCFTKIEYNPKRRNKINLVEIL